MKVNGPGMLATLNYCCCTSGLLLVLQSQSCNSITGSGSGRGTGAGGRCRGFAKPKALAVATRAFSVICVVYLEKKVVQVAQFAHVGEEAQLRA